MNQVPDLLKIELALRRRQHLSSLNKGPRRYKQLSMSLLGGCVFTVPGGVLSCMPGCSVMRTPTMRTPQFIGTAT